MKKLLLLMITLFGLQTLSSQILQSENFNSLPIGNIGTDITGTIPTNNFLTLSTNYNLDPLVATTSTNAGNSNFQIVTSNDVNHGNVLQIEGPNGTNGRKNMWQDELAGQWLFRDGGNDIIEVEFELYTGTAGGASANTTGVYIYDNSTGTSLKILGGFVFNTKTLVLTGIAYFAPTDGRPIGNYGFFLGPTGTNITLNPNEWVKLAVNFNKTTGQVFWKGPTFLGQVTGAAIGLDPDKVAFVARSGSAEAVVTPPTPAIVNNAVTTGLFDNLIVKATATNNLSNEEQIQITNNEVSVFPNPATNFIGVSSKQNIAINGVTLSDLNGRIVKSQSFENVFNLQINISDMASGVYIININSDKGTITKKIIKN